MSEFDSVDETLRRKFEAAWAAGEPLGIDQCLPPRDSTEFIGTLEELIHIEMEFVWKKWADENQDDETLKPGDTEVRPSFVEVYVERFKELVDDEILLRLLRQEFLVRSRFDSRPDVEEYRRRFPDLELSGQALDSQMLQPSRASDDEIRKSAELGAQGVELGDFGDYELLDELGRGGMGIVYRARQKNADRIVALKLIRQDQLAGLPADTQTKTMERFRTEAQSTAKLEHDNIVTVYDVGEHDGQHFYSMRFVDGRSLFDIVLDGPLDRQRAAQYIQQAANGLHEAHAAGILHRDLKPQNIMLDEKQDRVLVADFGLAKLVEGTDELTLAGEVMGTPSYMPPEQTKDAKQVTAQSDVYSLGATLYHLLTGRPPFQAATPLETLRQVFDEEPATPSQLNREIERDLETICMKCLQKEPGRRYASAGELAADLGRFLRDEPILARPISPVERSVRWCRRNPALATTLLSAIALAFITFTAVTWGYISATIAWRKTEAALAQARATVDYYFTEVSENVLFDQPGLQPVRKELLQRALDHYKAFLAQHRGDIELQAELGRAHYRVGRITADVESVEASLASFDAAIAIQQKLVDRNPDSLEAKIELANSLTAKGGSLGQLDKWQQALKIFVEARTIREDLANDKTLEKTKAREVQRKLANAYMNIGIAQRTLGELDQAHANFQLAIKIRNKLLNDEPTNRHVRRDTAMGWFNFANFSRKTEEWDDAKEHLLKAIPIFEDLLAEQPNDFNNQDRLAICYRIMGDILVRQAKSQFDRGQVVLHSETLARAHEWFNKAVDEINRLVTQNAGVVDFELELASALINRGTTEMSLGDTDSAAYSFEDACYYLSPHIDTSGPAIRYDFAIALQKLGRVNMKQQQWEHALEDLDEALNQFEQLINQKYSRGDLPKYLKETSDLRESVFKAVPQLRPADEST